MDANQNSTQIHQSDASSNQKGILLMDTDVINQKLVSKMLRKIGYPVFFAENDKEALKILDTHNVELILLDAQLRKNNGSDITRIAREKEKTKGKRIPIVILTDKPMKVYREKCISEGLDEFLPKPVFENEICRVIGNLADSS